MTELKYQELVGLQWDHGKQDCYTLAQQFFYLNFGIKLRDYARPDEWWNHGLNLYMDNFRNEGFEVVDVPLHKMQLADVMLMAIKSEQACHCGVYVGEGEMLHHFYQRFSTVEPIRKIWRNSTVAIIRHNTLSKGLPKSMRTSTTVDLMEHLLPHKRKMLEKALAERG